MAVISMTNGQNSGANRQNPNIVNINKHLNTVTLGQFSGIKNSKHHPTMHNNSIVPDTHCISKTDSKNLEQKNFQDMNGSSSFFNINKRNFGEEKNLKSKNDKNSPMRFKTRDSEADFPSGDLNPTENSNGACNILESPCQIRKKIRTLLDNETESIQATSINA
jgi:hypothetical protein